jgi:hypothetical protein
MIVIGIIGITGNIMYKTSTYVPDEYSGDFTNDIICKTDSIKSIKPELTVDNVLKYIIKLDIKHPLIVLKQAVYETGWFKCINCSLDENNLFGFRRTKDYLKFNHWTESVEFYKEWQSKYYKEGDYYQFITKIGYAEDSNYINRLKSIKL